MTMLGPDEAWAAYGCPVAVLRRIGGAKLHCVSSCNPATGEVIQQQFPYGRINCGRCGALYLRFHFDAYSALCHWLMARWGILVVLQHTTTHRFTPWGLLLEGPLQRTDREAPAPLLAN